MNSSLQETEIRSLITPYIKKPFVFLETANFDKDNAASFFFRDFSQILTFNHNDDADSFFKRTEDCLNDKLWLCGFFSYEFGYFLEPALNHLGNKNDFSLAWLGACKNPVKINRFKDSNFSCKKNSKGFKIKKIKPDISYGRYETAIRKIKRYLKSGDNYQTNFTFKIKFSFSGDVLDFYLALRDAQPTSYMALINTGEHFIISLSPELFFKIKGNNIITRPMKGSLQRGLDLPQDKANEIKLKTDKKINAENLMIVDLLRNDLGRISKKVWVPELFCAEKYRTIYQMTSTVSAQLKNNTKIKDVFSALFPSGSVTGAPKIKTMEIINKLEGRPRGIYTGAIGYIAPNKNACFNVAIRTISLSKGKGEMGVGGGIVYDSCANKEYEEALLKAKFLTSSFSNFSLIETMLYDGDNGYFLLPLHLKRLKDSCEYFSININFDKLNKALKVLENKLKKSKSRVRLLVDFKGAFTIETLPFSEPVFPVKIKLSLQAIDPQNNFLYHKTTEREFYDSERKKAQQEGFFEVIFLNKYGEATEGSITNIFILKGKTLYTPPVKCGLLPGVLREHLLKSKQVKEKVLYKEDILTAKRLYIGNSVRGLLPVEII